MKQGVVYFSFTIDAWTSRVNHSYITHTAHYIDKLWNLGCHLLYFTEITSKHTAVNLAEKLQESLARWDLPEDKLVAVTTDSVQYSEYH